ncbi:GNAT family N-acetyltransferase [Pseudomonas sp. S75]|uniref:GNAT family N-acetyltransferase n=1 Tax=unclassified Pseudomonas TaxID=196821 RepID=UPI0019088F20|nr:MULTISPECIES: GNAT family N-acetyltransferase [unclassified Pseudomonas]MBJ9974231.1 GNAT family N-acetyltransferase [Pseudomonas sp. S30]MBK0151839.1 GNAT family N-acetyltransferase [Pseudomonas sp. S75]
MNVPPLRLGPASEADRNFARDLTRRAMLPYYQQFDLRWVEEAFDQAWSWREQFLIQRGDQVLGFCSLSQDTQALFIRELHLLPAFRGQGVGSWALEELANWSRQRRLPLLRLMVFSSNPARRLYTRAGFIEMGQDACFVRMQRNLGKPRT